MTEIVRAIRGAAQNRTNVILTLGGLAFVLLMLFIPELVNLSTDKTSRTTVEESVRQPDIILDGIDDSATTANDQDNSPLSAVSRMLGGGEVVRARLAPQAVTKGTAPLTVPPGFTERNITWQSMTGGEGGAALGKARNAAQEILKTLPERFKATHTALNNYVNGIKLVRSGAESGMTPRSAFDYLASLDSSVTRAMISESIDRDIYRRWQGISLGEVFNASRLAREKKMYKIPFRPGLTLEQVQVFKPGNIQRQDGKIYVNITGFVRGKEVERIDVYENGEYIAAVNLRYADRKGIRKFTSALRDARAVITFIVTDKFGETYEKSYQFYPRVRRFPLSPKKQGTFLINLPNGREDPALDRFFRVRDTTGEGSSNKSFVSF